MLHRTPCLVGESKTQNKSCTNIPMILLFVGIAIAAVGFIAGFALSIVLIAPPIFIIVPTPLGILGFVIGAAGLALMFVGIFWMLLAKRRS